MRVFVGFSRKRLWYLNPFGLLIMAFESIPFSHCYVRFEHELGSMVYESVWPKSRSKKFGDWLFWNEQIREFELVLDPSYLTKFISATYSQLGKTYSIAQLISIGWYIMTRKYCFLWASDNDHRKNICTEYVAHCLMTQGVQFEKDSDMLMLKDIYRAVRIFEREKSHGINTDT